MKNITLSNLAKATNFILSHNKFNDIIVNNITANSLKVVKNTIFVAIKGVKFNGEDYIIEAIKNGASVCIIDKNSNFLHTLSLSTLTKQQQNDISSKIVAIDSIKNSNLLDNNDNLNTKAFLAKSLFYIYKDNLPKNILTITGTNGKTSVAFFISQFLTLLNKPNMLIGTLGVFINTLNESKKLADTITTPGVEDLCNYLLQAKAVGIDYVVMESSSHGISQNRILGINFNVAGFTNLSQDHLDYHTSMEDYFQAKAKLFTNFNIKNVVINTDDIYGAKLASITNALNVLDYGKNAKTAKIISINLVNNSQEVVGLFNNKNFTFNINILGQFQVYNILCSMLMLTTIGEDFFNLITLANKIKPAEGRLTLIKAKFNNNKFAKIFIDYAHTPDALENVLKTLQNLDNTSNIKVIFGCGGDRDTAKRPIMGAISAKYANVIYLADDNPRSEDPSLIRQQIIQGIKTQNSKVEFYNIGDRKLAIQTAINNLNNNDILIVAGKGHEEYQIIGNIKNNFSDKQEVINCLINNGALYEL